MESHVLTTSAIASWFDVDSAVSLPAIQRSAVWRPAQIEALWDSMCRGFPIGSFLLAPYDEGRGTKALRAAAATAKARHRPKYHLLDGQQRSIAIALGFRSPWAEPDLPAALWVDLAAPEGKRGDSRKFIFRVVTRSHPWGYMRSDPDTRLEAHARRAALQTFARHLPARHQSISLMPGKADLAHTWPWESVAPVPITLLMDALAGRSTRAALQRLRRSAEDLPFWTNERFEKARAILSSREISPHVESLVQSLRQLAGPRAAYTIPIQKFSKEASFVTPGVQGETLQIDPVETLFVRVNAGGTRLDGEELSYSILKSIWPQAEKLVDSLGSRLVAPSRLVMLFTRLLLARKNGDFPPTQDVIQFRRLVHKQNIEHPDFLPQLKALMKSGEAARLLRQASGLLTAGEGYQPDIGLPKVLVAEVARTCPDGFLLLLRWLDRCAFTGDQAKVAENINRYLVGALTTFCWYANDQRLGVKAVWDEMEKVGRSAQIRRAWGKKGLLRPAVVLRDAAFLLVPPIKPTAFAASVRKRTSALCNKRVSKAWASWTWERHFVGAAKNDPALVELTRILARASRKDDGFDRSESAANLWSDFAATTWGLRSLVLYAQRSWLAEWFPDFDPARPDQIEDTDRPWDLDHIHAVNYVKNIKRPPPQLKALKEDWHGCIGNLRAWPLELNRGDGDVSPQVKLSMPTLPAEMAKLAEYGIATRAQLLQASVLQEKMGWHITTPAADFPVNYLKERLEHYPLLLKAIVDRWLLLYSQWYRDFRVGHLF